MILAHWRGRAPQIFALLTEARSYGCYTETDRGIEGLIYEPFTRYVRDHYRLEADVITDLDRSVVVERLSKGELLLASVHPEIRNAPEPPPSRGGHLVLLTGTDLGSESVIFNNPSGHRSDNRDGVEMAWEDFDRFAAGRGISIRR